MSKITFRADDDLVNAIERLDESKSEVMRDALRAYLERHENVDAVAQTLDDAVAERVDELVGDRLESLGHGRDVNVNISVEPGTGGGVMGAADRASGSESDRDSARSRPVAGRGADAGRWNGVRTGGNGARESDVSCPECGASVAAEHAFCPNCGGTASRRLFCECGDEIRADWAFCPHCGRRTASADALDR